MFHDTTKWENCYSIKDQLKALGAKWDGAEKVWVLPAQNGKGREKAAQLGRTPGVNYRKA